MTSDTCQTADPGVSSSIFASHTFVEIDHEILSTVIPTYFKTIFKNKKILLLSADSRRTFVSYTQKYTCTKNWLTAQEKGVVR